MYTHPYMAAHLSCPTGSSSLRWVLTSFVLPVHNQGASLATIQGHALWFNFLPATSSFFVLSLLIQTLRLQHLSADAYCNHYGCSLLLGYAAFNCSPGCLISFNIFDASYLIPLVRIAWNTLISLHATTISDCIFFNGFFSLPISQPRKEDNGDACALFYLSLSFRCAYRNYLPPVPILPVSEVLSCYQSA